MTKSATCFLSVVIPTYQRRDKLLRLIDSLGEAIDDDSTEVVVVVDGSTDGTVEAITDLVTDFPLRWRWQENQGPAVARNVGIAMAKGAVCWLIDDDKTIEPAGLAAHRRFHESSTEPSVLMGPTWELGPDPFQAGSTAKRDQRLSDAARITEATDFRSGNVSMPRSLLLKVGGFQTEFVGWGEEDVELGYRLIKTGVPIHFDGKAGSWHDRIRASESDIQRERERGRNLVRLWELHPEALNRPPIAPRTPRPIAFLYGVGVRSTHLYGAIASASALMLRQNRLSESKVGARVGRLGHAAARIAGLIEAGGPPEVVERFGFPRRTRSQE